MNKLIKEKVAIVSDKAGTTRDQIKGIINIGENQYIFMDTPGIHKPKHLLVSTWQMSQLDTLNNADLILFMLDGTQGIVQEICLWMENAKNSNTLIVLIINKLRVFNRWRYSIKIRRSKREVRWVCRNNNNDWRIWNCVHKIFEMKVFK